jgi:hypothetical protein
MAKPKLIQDNIPAPPRPLGAQGLELWSRVQREYRVTDAGGIEMLASACESCDRAYELRKQIDKDGVMTEAGREHPLLKHEVAARAFTVRTIEKLGLNFEPVKSVGRPGGKAAGWAG